MNRGNRGFALLAVAAVLAIGGCGSSNDSRGSPSTESTSATPKSGSSGRFAVVNTFGLPNIGMTLVASKKLGEVTLYEFRKDKGTTSSCYGACAKAWPPLLTTGEPEVGSGAYAAELGTTKRRDGTTQVTYAGHPVYRFSGDAKRLEANGNGVMAFGGEWHVLKDPKYAHEGPPVITSGPVVLTVAKQEKVGRVLVTSEDATVYEYTKDKGSTPTCYGGCASAWVPVITDGAPKAKGEALASKLGTTKRNNGTIQVTYAGRPLYTYVQDKEPGNAYAEGYSGFGGIWYALRANGERVKP